MRERLVDVGGAAPARAVAVEVAPQPTSAVGRLGFVDSLRALAALYVVGDHITSAVWSHSHVTGSLSSILTPLTYGHFAVSVFIVLSGFSLMLPVARRGNNMPWSVLSFYWRRARRILPPYYLALALSLLLIWLFMSQQTGPNWDVSLPITTRDVVEHLLLAQDFTSRSASVNYAFWSIAMECQIYLLFPALVLLFRRYPTLVATGAIAILSIVALYALLPTWLGHLPGYETAAFAPQYVGLFGMGMFGGVMAVAPSRHWVALRDRSLWEGVAALGCGLFIALINTWPPYALDFCLAIGTVGLLLAAARPSRRNPLRVALEWRPLVWIGGFSYSIYLIHAPLIHLLWQYGLRPLGLAMGTLPTYLALLVVGLPLIVAASWLFWWGCERPFLNSRPLGWRSTTQAQASAQASAFADVRAHDKTR